MSGFRRGEFHENTCANFREDDLMTDFLQIVTTASTREEADTIAQSLVAKRLAACVQVWGPVHSTYRWQDQLESGQEWACAIKTSKALYGAVERAIRELHSYEVPEILAF